MSFTLRWIETVLTKKEAVLQNWDFQAWLKFATAHIDKPNASWRNVLWLDKTNIELLASERGSNGETLKPKNTITIVKSGSGNIMPQGCFAASGTGTYTKWIE